MSKTQRGIGLGTLAHSFGPMNLSPVVLLLLVKKAKKKGKMVRETTGLMLNYLHKDIRILMDLLAKNKTYYESLFLYEKRTLTAILRMYHQQEEMYRSKTHTCAG